jgi:alkylation response protein AidB-like acyl-CoA dehydrogenase
MDLTYSPAEEAFRQEVRRFIVDNYPKHLRGKARGEFTSREDFLAWHRILHKQGWVAPAWPKQYGGTGWTSTQRYIFSEECARAETAMILPFGINMVGPVIYTFGTEEQKKQHLPKILSGDVWWCQGYSEPGAGSDLASLKTTAIREGDHYIVNGQKTWTTLAQHADWIFVLARTSKDAKQQEGISFLLIDMKTPGVSVKPIITMDGAHEVNEVWLDNVKVPVSNRIGEENKGWTCAKFLLSHERAGIAGVARSKRGVQRLKDLARMERDGESSLLKDPDFSRNIADLEIDLTALEYTELRTLAGEAAGKGPGLEASILKIKGTDIQQRLTELTMEAVGYYGMPYRPHGHELETLTNEYVPGPDHAQGVSQSYFLTRRTSIYGGSNEIQRNIIAKMVLGL